MSAFALVSMVLLLLLNGFFVAAEFAFTAARGHRLAAGRGRAARAASAAVEELSFTLSGAQLGITIASLLLGVVAEPALASLFEPLFEDLGISKNAGHTIAIGLALLIVVFLHMVVGEMAPKNIAISDPERYSLLLALPYRVYSQTFRPFIWVLNGAANLGLRIVGVDPSETAEAHTVDDLAALIAAGRREGIVEDFAHRLLTGAIDLPELRAETVMVPRPDVVAVPSTASPADIERIVIDEGYSRIPVYEDTLDAVIGFVHAKDLLRVDPDSFGQPMAPELIRPMVVVPSSSRVDDLLETMRGRRNHLALVIDEHGGTAGIVSMEDIVEEIVGDLRDEHDDEAPGVRRLGPRKFSIDASLRLTEVERATGIVLPDGDYDTVGGLVLDRLGRMPRAGDRVDAGVGTIVVRSMAGLRVGVVEIVTSTAARDAPEGGEGP